VNLENDLIAKYVEKFVRQADAPAQQSTRINAAFLAEHGFGK
jgi:riboflavin synthase alpha subunit